MQTVNSIRRWFERSCNTKEEAKKKNCEALEVAADIVATAATKVRRLRRSVGSFANSCKISTERWLNSPRERRWGNTSAPEVSSLHLVNEKTESASSDDDAWFTRRYGMKRPSRESGAKDRSSVVSRSRQDRHVSPLACKDSPKPACDSDSSARNNSGRISAHSPAIVRAGPVQSTMKPASGSLEAASGPKVPSQMILWVDVEFKALAGVLEIQARYTSIDEGSGSKPESSRIYVTADLGPRSERIEVFSEDDNGGAQVIQFAGQQLYPLKQKRVRVEVFVRRRWWGCVTPADTFFIDLSRCDFSDKDTVWNIITI